MSAAIIMAVLSGVANAADHYLSNKPGSGSGTKEDPFGLADLPGPDNKPTKPLTVLEPGDTLYFRGGEYALHTGPVKQYYYVGYLRPARSGEPGKPISFCACPGEEVVLAAASGGQPIFGNFDRDYVRHEGFVVKGSIGHVGGRGAEVAYCEIIGEYVDTADNHDGIRVEHADGAWIHHTIIHGVKGKSGNSVGIKVYTSENLLIEDNWIYDNIRGIFDKDSGIHNTYRRNLLAGNQESQFHGNNQGKYMVAHIYDNVIDGGVALGYRTDGTDVHDNLVRGDMLAGHWAGDLWNSRIWNNIVIASGKEITAYNESKNAFIREGDRRHLAYMDYNVYTAPPKYTFARDRFTLDEMRGKGFEVHSQVVRGASDVYEDGKSWKLREAWRKAGRYGDALGPEDVARILDTTRYGPRARPKAAGGQPVGETSRQGRAVKLPFRADRPRLLFTEDQLPAIRKRCEGPYAQEYKAMAAWADGQVERVLSSTFDEEVREAARIEDKYARANRGSELLDPIETFGFLWHLTREERYARAGRRLVDAGFEISFEDFDAAMAYDLFYDVLTGGERVEYGKRMIEHLRSKQGYHELGFHGGRKTKLLISLYGAGIEEAEVNARLGAAYEFAHSMYLATYSQLAKHRGGWNEGFFCGCMGKDMHVPFWWTFQNATGQRLFETHPMFFGMGNWVMYGLMDVSQDPPELGKYLVPVGSAPFGADKIAQQGLDVCAYLARDSVGAWLSRRIHPKQGWRRILLEAPEVQAVEPREMPETALFEGWGWVSMRSSWASDGVFAHFTCGPKGQGEPSHLDDNQFVIYRKGLLAIDGFAPADHVGGNYGQMSLAHNTITVWDPEERIRGASTYLYNSERSPFAVNDGGQTFWPERRDERRIDLETARDGYANVRGPSALVWRGRIVAYETGPLYDYVCGDATASYNSAKLTRFTRQFLFLKPDIFIVFDRVGSTKKEFRKRWHLQVYEEPAIEGRLVRADHQGGRLWCRTVLPEKAVLKKVQGAKVGRPDGSYEAPTAWEKCGTTTWRLDVGPEEPQEEDVFLHVLQAVDAGAPVSFDAQTIRKGERIGVRVARGGRAFEAVFSTTGTPAGAVTISDQGKVIAEAELAAGVRDTYAKWKDDPRFKIWMTDARFRYLIPQQDRERFGGPGK